MFWGIKKKSRRTRGRPWGRSNQSMRMGRLPPIFDDLTSSSNQPDVSNTERHHKHAHTVTQTYTPTQNSNNSMLQTPAGAFVPSHKEWFQTLQIFCPLISRLNYDEKSALAFWLMPRKCSKANLMQALIMRDRREASEGLSSTIFLYFRDKKTISQCSGVIKLLQPGAWNTHHTFSTNNGSSLKIDTKSFFPQWRSED